MTMHSLLMDARNGEEGICFGIVLFMLRTPWSQHRQQVERALDTAQRTNYPFALPLSFEFERGNPT